jgi:hypothetical protein
LAQQKKTVLTGLSVELFVGDKVRLVVQMQALLRAKRMRREYAKRSAWRLFFLSFFRGF